MRKIYRTNGLNGLFQGHSATLLRIFPYAAIKFMAYEQIKMIVMPTKQDATAFNKFLAGSLAGCTSVFFTYPLDILRVRLAFERRTQSGTLLSTATKVYMEPNKLWSNVSRSLLPVARLLNFYRGFLPTMYGMIPYAGVSFMTYESLKTWCESVDFFNHNGKLTPLAYLGCGAVSGMIAQTSSYPIEIIRRQMQVAALMDVNNKHTTTWSTFKDILQRKGFRGLWVGLTIGYLKIVPMFAVSFFSYEYLKQMMHIN
ncbi:mitochondrial carrier domain-containing protein [Gorgonomyces haynaldii]|nr:mitochondrial carrier domain-containing protein [Gorgonomyces haynaldii]